MERRAKYFLVDIDGTITDYRPEALDRSKWVAGNFLFPVFRDLMVERGEDPEEAERKIAALAERVIYWDYPDFIAEFGLPAAEACRRMRRWHRENMIFYPETVALLKDIRRSGGKLFIMSNNPHVGCLMKLEVAGLADEFKAPLFESVFGTNILRGCKGDRDVWLRALSRIPADPSEVGVIGDNPAEDGDIPRSCGMTDIIILPRKSVAPGI